ncbi:glycosyltransferase family 4 protein [Pseudalkalibacillus hwajinpoensis]|uniref:Undecaprenyl/decaprenyl-phosphate alpha-N-acetylglucosaminyl 1-phosphate transferase n=1 Tax=Guptibacillus hwajinpoensis TaxID=208199 RepID=A0A4U1MKE9_9BACL|nr:MraY family glycosyltransferase [Pseudalkalibacillus hwajinpoensis]TKD70982.1 undecaprenyl/decaprenyl-phosphate alpha-N-acetylglucosaminyl 1-phosphate transferase [Pseudalkalibacillus hwajinpoensis]
MYSLTEYIIAFLISIGVAIIATPIVKYLSLKFKIADNPNQRKVHKGLMPSAGGLAIFAGTAAGFLYLMPYSPYMTEIVIAGTLIIVLGVFDDRFVISPKVKLIGQIIAAVIVATSGLQVEFVSLPFVGRIEFGFMSFIITVLWIVGVTNSINLIDGLDGLAAGVSTIAIGSILTMAVLDQQLVVIALAVILIGSTLGFLIFNFHPASIFMGDTGALFLGFSISVISMLGLFKSVTVFSLIIPVIILAVPIFDTFFAIIRRVMKKQKISTPDKFHIHHCLLAIGFSHQSTVIIIYLLSFFFGITAILFSASTLWGSLFLLILLLVVIQFTAELIGVIGNQRKPLINTLKKILIFTSTMKR